VEAGCEIAGLSEILFTIGDAPPCATWSVPASRNAMKLSGSQNAPNFDRYLRKPAAFSAEVILKNRLRELLAKES
jgi:hypothetical protein